MSIQPSAAVSAIAARPIERGGTEPKVEPKAEAAKTVDKSPAPPSQAELKSALETINKSMQAQSQSLEFSIDEDSERTVVKVVDVATGDVIRQMPTPEALEISKALSTAQGLLIKQTA